MLKGVSKVLFVMLLAMTSCSGHDDVIEGGGLDKPEAEQQTVTMTISRASASEFVEAGITQLSVYTYKVDRKITTLFDEQTVDVSSSEFNGAVLTHSFPLGETFQTVIAANVGSVTGKESLSTLTFHFDPLGDKEVWASPVIRFMSDKSVSELNFELDRIIARIKFEPAETQAELGAFDSFDKIKVTFTNLASSYMPLTKEVELSDLTVETDASAGYRTQVYTFATTSTQTNGGVNIEYFKAGNSVNTSASLLETGITYAASGDYTLRIPITSPDFVTVPWTTGARSASQAKFEVITSTL